MFLTQSNASRVTAQQQQLSSYFCLLLSIFSPPVVYFEGQQNKKWKGKKKKKRHYCSASSKTSFMGWPCSLALLTPRIWERIPVKQHTQCSLSCSGMWPKRSTEGAILMSLLPEKWLAQHGFKDERHQAREGEGLFLLSGARRTKQFLLQKKERQKKIESKNHNRTREYIISMQAGTQTEIYDTFFPQENVYSSHHMYTTVTIAWSWKTDLT